MATIQCTGATVPAGAFPFSLKTFSDDQFQKLMRLADAMDSPRDSRTLHTITSLYLLKLKAKANGEDSMAKNKRELTRFVEFAAVHGKTFAH